MSNVLQFPALEKKLVQLKDKGKIITWKDGKYKIIHQEVENLAKDFGIETDIALVHCDLKSKCAVVKAGASFRGKKYYSFGEVSPNNNDFFYPVNVAEMRAVDRAVLKALGLHGTFYSTAEIQEDYKNNEQQGIDLNHASVIEVQINKATHIGKLREILSDHKDYLTDLQNSDVAKFNKLNSIISSKMSQFNGGANNVSK